jgi:hypothetical protein
VARTLVIPEKESEYMSERRYLGENERRSLTSRRGFLTGSAKLLGGGALALGLGAAPAFAKGNGDDEDKKQGARETTVASQTSTSSTTPSF